MEIKWLFIAICVVAVSSGGYMAAREFADTKKPAEVLIYEKCMGAISAPRDSSVDVQIMAEKCRLLLESIPKRSTDGK